MTYRSFYLEKYNENNVKFNDKFLREKPWYVICKTEEQRVAFTDMIKDLCKIRYNPVKKAPVFLTNSRDSHDQTSRIDDQILQGLPTNDIKDRILLPVEYYQEENNKGIKQTKCRFIDNKVDPSSDSYFLYLKIKEIESKMEDAMNLLDKMNENRKLLISEIQGKLNETN